MPAPEVLAANAAKEAAACNNSDTAGNMGHSYKMSGESIPTRSRGQPRPSNRRTTSERC